MQKFIMLKFSLIILFFTFQLPAQKTECNYIRDYYPIVYQGQIEYLKGNFDKAYDFFDKARYTCELLNNQDILESVIFAELSAKKGLFEQAFDYLRNAVKDGFYYGYLEGNDNLNLLKSRLEWNLLKKEADSLSNLFNNTDRNNLRSEIISMIKEDQKVRIDKVPSEMKKIDSKHEMRIKEIFNSYGYPNSKLIGSSTPSQNVDISTMMMHFSDVEYFEPILLEFIKNGECSPFVLANMVDSNDRKRNLFTYGIYDNLDSTLIKDFKNLNARRTSIGLRTLEQHKETRNLIIQKYRSKN